MSGTDTAAFSVDWSTVSAGWDDNRHRVEVLKAELSDQMVAGIALQPGNAVLELGAGTGELAKRLAGLVGPAGRVVASDVAPGMVDLIAAATADMPNVETAVIDGAATGQPDAAYDAIVFRMGLMFIADPAAALRDHHRILKPGGRLAAATWAGMAHNPWLTTVGMAGMIHGLLSGGLPMEPGGPLSLGDPEPLRDLAIGAGFAEATVTEVDILMKFPDVDHYLGHVTALAPPFAAAFPAASDEQRAAVNATVTDATEPYRTDSGLAIPGRALLLVARR